MPSDTPPVRHRGQDLDSRGAEAGHRQCAGREDSEREAAASRSPTSMRNPYRLHASRTSTCGDSKRSISPWRSTRRPSPRNDRSTEQRLAALKMIAGVDDPRPTIAGILVLGTNPQDFLPAAYAQFLRIAGTELADPVVDDGRCSGPIAHLVRCLDDKLLAHNRTAVDFASGPTETRAPAYPMAALQQLVSQRRHAQDLRGHERADPCLLVRRSHRDHEPGRPLRSPHERKLRRAGHRGLSQPDPGRSDASARIGPTLRRRHPDGAARPASPTGSRLPTSAWNRTGFTAR